MTHTSCDRRPRMRDVIATVAAIGINDQGHSYRSYGNTRCGGPRAVKENLLVIVWPKAVEN